MEGGHIKGGGGVCFETLPLYSYGETFSPAKIRT